MRIIFFTLSLPAAPRAESGYPTEQESEEKKMSIVVYICGEPSDIEGFNDAAYEVEFEKEILKIYPDVLVCFMYGLGRITVLGDELSIDTRTEMEDVIREIGFAIDLADEKFYL